MKKWIRSWLGITEVQKQQDDIWHEVHTISNSMKDAKILIDIGVHNRALSRIIAKLDPMYGVSEFDPDRVEASRKLEDEIMAKLTGEHLASNRTPQ